ncbi:ribonuclease H-like domain-containing protein [Tanacetum coccineum]|uniref:Ribonuclease H-like domain-containing protein n=1 Tax=Tanacetum coccineum TaxID=301880 RepID=A0ABQ4X113_9ASTR
MTGNISYLSEYEPYDGGYVSFGHGGGKITGKVTIKTSKLELENVYFVKELKYNLFSVSQICDNKNSVLFTDSECLVLGKEFKVDDSHASMDESMMWRKRLGHLNFKPMNKLVRNNLVRDKDSFVMMNCSRRDNGGEFKNREMDELCTKKGIKREFSNARTLSKMVLLKEGIELSLKLQGLCKFDAKKMKVYFVDTPYLVKSNLAEHLSTNISWYKRKIANQDGENNVSSLRFIALPNWFHDAHMETSNNSVRNSKANDDPQ